MKTISEDDDLGEILSDAIDAEAHLTITRKTNNGWQLLKSKFQGADNQNIKVATPVIYYGKEEEPHGEVAVSFRDGGQKMIFKTTFDHDSLFWPKTMVQVSRHVYKRKIPNKSSTVRFWNQTQPRDIHDGELANISGGGFGVLTRSPREEGIYMCAIDVEPRILAESLLKRHEPQDSRFLLNFQFLGADLDPVNHLQRITRIQRKFKRKRNL